MEEDLKEVLGKCHSKGKSGHRFPQSLLTPYLSSLFVRFLESIASSSHVQPKARKPVDHHLKPTASRLPCPISKPACLERFVPEIRIPMPSYRPMFNRATLSFPTSSTNANPNRPPLAEITHNSFLRNLISNAVNSLTHPPKSIWDENEDTDDIVSITSTVSHFTIQLPMK